MARSTKPVAQRPRVSVDVTPEIRRRLRIAAAKRDMSIRGHVLDAIHERLQEDLGDEMFALTAQSDPVLAELWDNPADALYDQA